MDAKPWWKSKTILGHVFWLALYFAGKFGVSPIEPSAEVVLVLDAAWGFFVRFFTRRPVTNPLQGVTREV